MKLNWRFNVRIPTLSLWIKTICCSQWLCLKIYIKKKNFIWILDVIIHLLVNTYSLHDRSQYRKYIVIHLSSWQLQILTICCFRRGRMTHELRERVNDRRRGFLSSSNLPIFSYALSRRVKGFFLLFSLYFTIYPKRWARRRRSPLPR